MMKRIICLLTAVLVVSAGKVEAQQDPLYSQYNNNLSVINPAFAGLTDDVNVNLSYRKQWNGIAGAPSTANLTATSSILDNKGGVGIMAVSDVIGNQTTTEFYAMGAYRVNLNSKTILSFGLQAGAQNFNVNKDKITPYDVTDNLFQSVNKIKPEIGSGLILMSERYLVGLSVPRMLKPDLMVSGNKETLYTQHYYFTGSYKFVLSHRVTFKPSALVKYVKGAPVSIDFNPSIIVDGKWQAGVLVRNTNSYGAFFRALVNERFLFGMTYEDPTRKSVGPNYVTYEVNLGLRMKAYRYHKTAHLF